MFNRLCGILLLYFSLTFAVSSQTRSALTSDTLMLKQRDIMDFYHAALKSRVKSDTSLVSKRGPYYSFLPAVGYALQSGLTAAVAVNASFYTKKSTHFSNILLNANYSEYKQYWFKLNCYVLYDKHKLRWLGDTRYYNFPTHSYGLGSNSLLNDALAIDYSYLRFYQVLFKEFSPNVFFGMGYSLDYHWAVSVNAVPGRALEEFNKYEKGSRSSSSGINFNFLFDNRHNPVNPQKGSYIHLQFRPNLKMLGSDRNWQSMLIDVRHYIKFPSTSRNVLALWSYNDLTLRGTPPYLDMPSIGWDDYSNTGRGYVPGRFTGLNLFYLESEYRFAITRNGLLGGVVFGNAESILRHISSEINSLVPGGGFGLRIKVNKYSNTNIAVDYGFGVGNSHGFFFNLGEVF